MGLRVQGSTLWAKDAGLRVYDFMPRAYGLVFRAIANGLRIKVGILAFHFSMRRPQSAGFNLRDQVHCTRRRAKGVRLIFPV